MNILDLDVPQKYDIVKSGNFQFEDYKFSDLPSLMLKYPITFQGSGFGIVGKAVPSDTSLFSGSILHYLTWVRSYEENLPNVKQSPKTIA